MKIKDIGEFGLIERIHAKAGRSSYPVVIGIGDDAAVLDVGPRNQIVTTTDMLVEGVHFLRDSIEPFDLGFKSHAVNLSDIAGIILDRRNIVLEIVITALILERNSVPGGENPINYLFAVLAQFGRNYFR